MTLEFEVNLSLDMAVIAIVSTIVRMVVFVTKTKWDVAQVKNELEVAKGQIEKEIARTNNDINGLGTKLTEIRIGYNDELRHILVRIDAMDKDIIQLTSDMKYISDTVKELKENCSKVRL
jgi:cell division protein FtsB